MKIEKGSRALIKWTEASRGITEGIVTSAQGDCVKIKTTWCQFGPLRVWNARWYSFDNPRYKLVVEQVAS